VTVVAVLTFSVLTPAGTATEGAASGATAPRATAVGYGPTAANSPTIESIRLRSGRVNTAFDSDTGAATTTLASSETGSLVVQFAAPITAADMTALDRAGAEVLAVLPDRALRIRIAEPRRLEEVTGIRWTGRLAPVQLVHPDVAPSAEQLVRVVLDPGANVAAAMAAAEAEGATMLRPYASGFVMRASRSVALAVAAQSASSWIEPWAMHETHNEYGGAIIGAGVAASSGYDGGSQIVAVADTGLGGGTADTAHRDISEGRVVGVQNYSADGVFGCYDVIPDGAIDADSGHGTHVAGTVLSDGGPTGEGLGVAPGTSLVFQATEEFLDVGVLCEGFIQEGYHLVGIPLDLADLLQDAYDEGARIHQDSWGSAVAGEYTADSAAVDGFVWEHQDLLMVVSAGNEGIDADSDGAVDEASIGSPATAKNVLSVGASENVRADGFPCDTSLTYTTCTADGGGNETFPYGEVWASDYPAPPISTDPSAGNAEQLAAFSSRGPTLDGRLKPDVVAPGTWILSAYSDLYQQGYDVAVNPQNGLFQADGWGDPFDEYYKYLGGTSMSAPMASGAAAIVRDFYTQAHDLEWISAALVKATLINSAIDLQDENNDGANDNDHPIPNNHEGWGRIDLAAATDDSHTWFDNGAVETGFQQTYATAILPGTPLKISLVWSDYAGTEACGACLVNNVDLAVMAPDSTTSYIGNNFANGWTLPGPATADAVNNVENVYIQSPAAGVWTIQVIGTDIPVGPQPFALVIDADFDESIDATAPTWTGGQLNVGTVTETSANLEWSGASDNVGVVAYDVFAGGDLLATSTSAAMTLNGLEPGTAYAVRVQARDAAGNTSTDGPAAEFTTIESDPPEWGTIELRASGFGETHLTLTWDEPTDVSGVAAYLVYQDGAKIADVTLPRFDVTGLTPNTTYAFRVEAEDGNGVVSVDGPRLDVTTPFDFLDTHGHIFETDIAWLSGSGITQGCDANGNFCPDASMTRAQMASLLARALNLDVPSDNRFTDVSGTHAGNINAIAAASITIGCSPDGTLFCPNDLVTRAQMATFIDRAFDLVETSTDYFADDDGSVHESAINRVAETRITLGCGSPGMFCPGGNVTRGQIAAFLHRAFVNLGID
ncbi:MAG: S8 family serine peptidase, partial [Acidimicrobiia bacterium]|nr:S8 family serine peptidase [Acidimicrobiia bacterium]